MENFGATYKKIRKSRCITQESVCQNLISRTTLSKFENNKLVPSITVFFKLLDRIDISMDEFIYIGKNYQISKKKELVNNFFSIFTNKSIEDLNSLHQQCINFLKENESKTIELLIWVIESLVELSSNDNKKIPCLPKVMLSIPWENLQQYSAWSLDDIKIINCCLYMFPFDVAMNISTQLINQLLKYEKLQDLFLLQSAIYLNVTLLCLQNGETEKGKSYVELAIQKSKKSKRYDYFSLATARKGFLYNREILIDQALDMSRLFEDTELQQLILEEKELYLTT